MRIIKINDNNPEDFDNNILGCDCIIKFHMDGCSHCENMKGDWDKMVKVLKKKPTNKDKVKIKTRKTGFEPATLSVTG